MDTRDFAREQRPDEEWSRLPGGWIKEDRKDYDLYRPMSLPHNRYPSGMFVVKLWVWIGFGTIGLLGFWAFYLWIRT